MSETYLVVTACRDTARVYHTDPDCFDAPGHYREVDADHVERRGLRECKVCAGEVDHDGGGRTPLRRLLKRDRQQEGDE